MLVSRDELRLGQCFDSDHMARLQMQKLRERTSEDSYAPVPTPGPAMTASKGEGKPLALDLCCGKGGWTNGLLATGWDVVGVDIKDMGGYQSHLFLTDAKTLTVEMLKAFQIEKYGTAREFALVVASPPCQDFSYSSLPFKKARAKFSKANPPDDSIWKACERIAKELGAPLILENVRGARKWIRKEDWHYGSFYFWGETPALLPTGCPRKGFGGGKHNPEEPFGFRRDGRRILKSKQFAGEYERAGGLKLKDRNLSAGRDDAGGREQWSAKVAMIPLELAEWIGRIFHPSPPPAQP